ncbi:MAG: hypothetical protein CMJ64_16350 [Planctomycetaceae bacterium]|nr:hypothetical protein [Planctomycetaceae bacterium]
MPRLLAIEWDLREARIAVANTRGKDVVVEHAFVIDLGPRDPGQTFADVNVGEKVAAALAARNVGRAETLVAVGRASIELRQLTLPTCPLEELPDMVRFQAMREFTTLGEDWPLDFVHLGASEDDGFNVLAAAISPTMVGQIRETCQSAELSPSRLILRPLAAASLLRRRDGHLASDCRLMVDLLSDEADLTILVDEHVALMRTVRLASAVDPAAQSRALLGEIRRTIASAQNQLGGRRVEKVVLCGGGSEQAALKSTIDTELSLPVELFDPFSEQHVDASALATRPEHAGRFAPLLGLLVDEAAESPHAIDFLHPHKKPEPPNNARRNLLVVGTAVAAGLAIVAGVLINLWNLDKELAVQRDYTADLKKDIVAAETSQRHQGVIQEFLDNDITWLDELSDLSERLPPPEEVIVTHLNFATRIPKGAQIVVDGLAKDSEQVTDVRNSLRANGRRLLSTGEQDAPRGDEYHWQFKETVLIEPGENRRKEPAALQDTAPQETAPQDTAQTASADSTNEPESQTR